MPGLILHHFDVINDRYISGWCFHRLAPWLGLKLRLKIGDCKPLNIRCDEFRQDVANANLKHSGLCGFTYEFIEPLDTRSDARITITTGFPTATILDCTAREIIPVISTDKPVVFVHIPKTAGTSFNNHVRGWFPRSDWHNHIEVLDTTEQRASIKPGRYSAGHLPLYKLRALIPDFSVVELHTFLREPYAQLHSHLAWLVGVGRESAFLSEHPTAVQESSLRLQSQSLDSPASMEKFVGELAGFERDFFDNIQVRYLLDHRPERVSEHDAVRAQENLSLFRTIGITERYNESIRRFADVYGRPPESQSSRHNPSRVAPLFDIRDQSIRAILKPLVVHDLALYETASKALGNTKLEGHYGAGIHQNINAG